MICHCETRAPAAAGRSMKWLFVHFTFDYSGQKPGATSRISAFTSPTSLAQIGDLLVCEQSWRKVISTSDKIKR